MKPFFITAIGTDIGKTFTICKQISYLKNIGKEVGAIKPIISGWNPEDRNMDTYLLMNSLNIEINSTNLQKISPWRLTKPLSPDIASDGNEINFQDLVDFCKESMKCKKDYFFIEGAGGIMTPINSNKTFLDLIKILEIPTILITTPYLGAISHTLTAYNALKHAGAKIHAVFINDKLNENSVDMEQFKKSLGNFIGDKVTTSL